MSRLGPVLLALMAWVAVYGFIDSGLGEPLQRFGPGRYRLMVRTVLQRAVPETTHEDATTRPEYDLPAEVSAWLKTTRQRKARRIQAKAAFLADPAAANLAELFYSVDLGECVPAEYEKTSAVEMGGADGKNDGREWPPTRSA